MVANIKTISLLTLGLFLLLAITPAIMAVQSTTQYTKIYLNPFYTNSMTQNVDYNYTVNIQSPDGMSNIQSAILTLDAWINPTRIFNAWMNDIQCNTKNYTISTTYASAGRGVVTFDCTNAIKKNQLNTVSFKVTGGNIGSSTSWIDISYNNNPKGDVQVHGTEYYYGDAGKVWLQLVDNNGTAVLDGVCFTDIYTPDGDELVEHATMTNMMHDGIYYYDLEIPSISGVYPAIARCYYEAVQVLYVAYNYTLINATLTAGTISNTYTDDAVTLKLKEINDGGIRRLTTDFYFNMSSCRNVSEQLLTGLTFYIDAKFDSVANDNISIAIYNQSNNQYYYFPNKLLEGNVFRQVSNSIEFNNISSTGFMIGDYIIIRLNDSSITDGGSDDIEIDYMYVSCDQLSNPEWQQVQGSSELHVREQLNVTLIASDIWNYTTRNLTYYEHIDMTNYTRIDNSIASLNQSINNQFDTLNNSIYGWYIDLKNTMLAINLSTYLQILSIPFNVWTYNTRNLTYYENFTIDRDYTSEFDSQELLINESTNKILQNLSVINNNLSQVFIRFDAVPYDVWIYTNRTLTYYPQQQDMTNYTLITENVWSYTNRTLTYYQVNNITSQDVWTYINRTLTYYEVNNITSQDVWEYNNRTLTYYPTSESINYTQIVDDVWSAQGRYIHGTILN